MINIVLERYKMRLESGHLNGMEVFYEGWGEPDGSGESRILIEDIAFGILLEGTVVDGVFYRMSPCLKPIKLHDGEFVKDGHLMSAFIESTHKSNNKHSIALAKRLGTYFCSLQDYFYFHREVNEIITNHNNKTS